MQPTKSDGTGAMKRRPWQPPALTVLAIGRETKSSNRNAGVRFQPNRAATAGRAGHKTRIFLGVGVSAVRSLGKVDQIHVAVEPDGFEHHDS
jgi:hypothetical protein